MPPTGERTLRADAQRNRDRLLEVAAHAFAAGEDPTLEAIAREAGVGIATLYRRNRRTLSALRRCGAKYLAAVA